MKKSVFVICLAIIFLHIFESGLSFAQNSKSSNHPYKLYFERRVSQFDKFPVPSGAIVFLGDSLVDEGRWDEMFPNHTISNRGILADRTEHVILRLGQITKWQPSKVFIMIGTNDLKFGIKQATLLSNYRHILNSIKKESPKTEVFVQSLLPREARFQKRIEKINRKLRNLAEDSGCTYIDLHSSFLDNDGSLRNDYTNDDLHLSGAGYLRWIELIKPYIQ